MPRRNATRRISAVPTETHKGLFINTPFDDDVVTKHGIQDEDFNFAETPDIEYVDISKTVSNVGTTSPNDLSRLKSPVSLVTSPIQLPKRTTVTSRLNDAQIDRPLSPRAATPKLIESSNEKISEKPRSPTASQPIKSESNRLKSPVILSSPIRSSPWTVLSDNTINEKEIFPRNKSESIYVKKGAVSPNIKPFNAISPDIKSKSLEKHLANPQSETKESATMSHPNKTAALQFEARNIPDLPKFKSPRAGSPRSIISEKVPVAVITDVSSESTPEALFLKKSPINSAPQKIEEIITGNIITPVRNKKRVDPEITGEPISSSKLPKIANRSRIVIDSTTPTRSAAEDEFTPIVGDELMRGGRKYIYRETGWKNSELYDDDNDTEEKLDEYKPRPSEKSDHIRAKKEKISPKATEKFMKGIPDYNLLTPEQEVYIRTKFDIKFNILRDTWKQYQIPTLSPDMPLQHIHIIYNHYVKHIYARENAQTYMLWVLLGWLIMEIVAVKLLGLPAGKFIEYRMKKMGKYKVLLIQLGEKYHGDFGEGWPVEIRIIVMSLIEMALFIAIRWFLGNVGEKGINTSVDTVSDLIDRYFGITGVSNPDRDDRIPPPPPPSDYDDNANMDGNRPRVAIPLLPEEPTDITRITSWIPTVTNTLGLNTDSSSSEPTNPPEITNSVADRIRARAANRRRERQPPSNISYAPPPFDS